MPKFLLLSALLFLSFSSIFLNSMAISSSYWRILNHQDGRTHHFKSIGLWLNCSETTQTTTGNRTKTCQQTDTSQSPMLDFSRKSYNVSYWMQIAGTVLVLVVFLVSLSERSSNISKRAATNLFVSVIIISLFTTSIFLNALTVMVFMSTVYHEQFFIRYHYYAITLQSTGFFLFMCSFLLSLIVNGLVLYFINYYSIEKLIRGETFVDSTRIDLNKQTDEQSDEFNSLTHLFYKLASLLSCRASIDYKKQPKFPEKPAPNTIPPRMIQQK